jgi:hypothetical protein
MLKIARLFQKIGTIRALNWAGTSGYRFRSKKATGKSEIGLTLRMILPTARIISAILRNYFAPSMKTD